MMLHSDYFRASFAHEFQEKESGKIELKEVDFPAEEFDELLQIISPQRKSITSKKITFLKNLIQILEENVVATLKIANFFSMPHLIKRCAEFLEQNKSLDIFSRLKAAEDYNLVKLMHLLNIRKFFRIIPWKQSLQILH